MRELPLFAANKSGGRKVKTLAKLALTAVILPAMATAPQASEFTLRPTGCIETWQDRIGFESIMPDRHELTKTTREWLTGDTVFLVVYVEHISDDGASTFIPIPRDMFLFATTDGRYVARIRDLPSERRASR